MSNVHETMFQSPQNSIADCLITSTVLILMIHNTEPTKLDFQCRQVNWCKMRGIWNIKNAIFSEKLMNWRLWHTFFCMNQKGVQMFQKDILKDPSLDYWNMTIINHCYVFPTSEDMPKTGSNFDQRRRKNGPKSDLIPCSVHS